MALNGDYDERGFCKTIVESDISGAELTDDDMYYFDDMVMNYKELVEYMLENSILKRIDNKEEYCSCCHLENAKYIYDEDFYGEICLKEEILSEFKTYTREYCERLSFIEELDIDYKRNGKDK